jgi:hypothetical protein
MTDTGAERVRKEAEQACQGLDVAAIEVTPLDDGYVVEIDVPKRSGQTDSQWHATIGEAKKRVEGIKAVKKVAFPIARRP